MKTHNYFRDYDPGIGRYVESDPIGLNGGVNAFGYVGGNPITSIDSLGLANVVYANNVPDYMRRYIEKNLEHLELTLINNTSSCSDATSKFLDLFFEWDILVSNIESPAGFAGRTHGEYNYTLLFKGRGSVGDLAHEFYHTVPENVNRKSGRGMVIPKDAPSENGPYGAYDFEGSVMNNECLCDYSNGESLPKRPPVDNRPVWKRFFGLK